MRREEEIPSQTSPTRAKPPADYNVETLVTKEEETENSKLQKQVQTMQDQILQLMKDKDKPTT